MIPDRMLGELRACVSASAIAVDPDVIRAHSSDQCPWAVPGEASVLVRPRSPGEIAATLEVANRHRVPVVPRGAGSGLSGGATAVDGGVLLALEKMDTIIDIDAEARLAVVEPGVRNGDLTREVATIGLWYPPDPASADISTIGGNIATDAGGLCCVKYGTTRRWTAGLEIALADGKLVQLGGATTSSAVGLNVIDLLAGSEGSLAVTTNAVLRLAPLPPPSSTLVAYFARLEDSGRAVSRIMRVLTPSLLEIMDRATTTAVESWKPMELDLDAAALLLLQVDDWSVSARREAILAFERVCGDEGATYCIGTDDPDEGHQLLQARRLAYPALERIGATILDDVAVPLSRVSELMARIDGIATRHELMIAVFGHAGLGNLHPTIVYDAKSQEAREQAESAFRQLIETTRSLDGTISGEHGVGVLKRDWVREELGAPAVALQNAIKAAFDPHMILNPGKVWVPS